MKYKSTIEKADNITAVLMTQNGFPVYDIMVPSTPGYCSPSGIAFYTEDEEVLKQFQKLNNKEKKEFLLSHPEYIESVETIFNKSPEMYHPMPLAYNHLIEAFEKTVKSGNYGCTHLIEGDSLLIFHQNKVFHTTGYKIDKNTSFNDLYDDMQTMIAKAYKEGKITPEGTIKGKALQRLKARNPDIFKEMTQYQSTTLDMLKRFKNELLDYCKLVYDKGDSLIVNMEIQNKNYVVNIPATSEGKIELTINQEKQEFKNIHDLVVEIYKDYSNSKLNSFMKKMKI